ncbi:MAG TPA: cupredoxin domain-containing protein [Anaeromyxobacter sp.]|nr:cupredoxin domain-containing protein [Anaeromyxobacter sp.]
MTASLRIGSIALLVALLAPASPPAQEPRVVEIRARRFEFTPNVVTLRKDEPVVLRLRTDDFTHGLYMKELGIDSEFAPGKAVDVPLTPRKAGRYSVICDHFCGSGHGNMKMTIVVE